MSPSWRYGEIKNGPVVGLFDGDDFFVITLSQNSKKEWVPRIFILTESRENIISITPETKRSDLKLPRNITNCLEKLREDIKKQFQLFG